MDPAKFLTQPLIPGIYTADPVKTPDARFMPEISYLDVVNKGLAVMDTTAISLCMDNQVPIIVFNIKTKGNITRAVMGEKIGSLVHDMGGH